MYRREIAMRKTIEVNKSVPETQEIICNACGKPIGKNGHGYFPDCLEVMKHWGYDSPFDGEQHCFDICVECYELMTKKFTIPIEKSLDKPPQTW